MVISTKLDSSTEGDILLVFPGKFRSLNPQVPLSLLYLAQALQTTGFKPRILDMRIQNYTDFNIGKPPFIGISSMSGQQIQYGLEFAKKIRTSNPSCPIVWGGVHPTLLPVQTAQSKYVDIVVRGEGEETIKELAIKLLENQPIDDVKGITYKSNGKIITNPDREFIDLDTLPANLPYELLHVDRYPPLRAGRIHIQTSRGCPHGCGFCYNSMFNKRKWRSKSPAKVVGEIEYFTRLFPGATCIDIVDDNFFVNKERVKEICKGKIKRGLTTPWRANCRLDYISSYEGSFLELLQKSNCIELNFGAETGSKRLLALIGKGVTREEMVNAMQKLRTYTPLIEPYVFWMSGFPTETKADLYESFTLMNQMQEANPKTQHVENFLYTPFPSPLLSKWRHTIKPITTLEKWATIDTFHYQAAWHSKQYLSFLETISAVMRYSFYPEKRYMELQQQYRFAFSMLNRMARFRWRHKFFEMPLELRLSNIVSKKMRGY